VELYNIYKESKPTCCTILLLFVVRYPTCFGQVFGHRQGVTCINIST